MSYSIIYPKRGQRIHMRHYSTGNVLTGTHDNPDYEAVGHVTETPHDGSVYLVLLASAGSRFLSAPQSLATIPDYIHIGQQFITLHRNPFSSEWTWRVAPTPVPESPDAPNLSSFSDDELLEELRVRMSR